MSINSIFAQQSYFNVPSSDRTKKGDFFFQQQVNYAENEFTSNSTLDWGITDHFEMGMNVLQVNFLSGHVLRISDQDISENEMVYPLITLNAQYFVPLAEGHQLSLGAISGFSFLNEFSWNENASLAFLNYQYRSEKIKLTSGLYSGNNHMFAQGTRFILPNIDSKIGLQIGCEVPILHEKLSMIADYFSGTHAWGVSTLGLAVEVPHHWIVSLGGFFPNFKSHNPTGIVFELTRAL